MNKFNPIRPLMDTDAYKLGHIHMYPEGTTKVLSNFTNRGTRIPRVTHVIHFGLQAFLQDWAINAWKPFFRADEDKVAELYFEFVETVIGTDGANVVGTDHIRALHRKGYLPLEFRAVPEGTAVPLRVPTFTIENTEPEFFWLVNYIETVISSSIWHPSTSATNSFYFRQLLDAWAERTTGSTEGVDFLGHDFSFRGMSGRHSAGSSGAGHLLSFTGSDNLNAINFINDFYPGEVTGPLIGSVPATEHSVMCAGGSDEGDELATYSRLLDVVPTGLLSVVSDTWDLWNVLTNILPALKDKIMTREGRLVIRPDSGDPVDILTGTGTSDAPMLNTDPAEGSPAYKGVVELLWDVFGGTVNEKGYKVLDPHIGTIYGDSITYERAEAIMQRLESKGFASTNVVFGLGSYTFQYVTRDTFASAIKATYVEINGEGKPISKDPITDNGTKKSARGRLAVIDLNGDLALVDDLAGGADKISEKDNLLKPVWRNGKFLKKQSFDDIRKVLREATNV